ncbi:aldo/keto reductase [Pseudorhodobacter sp. MZDSW-24AT]|uniref:aldo/keto reductase n=1 Tax=Pseudorhodobacter sp. MZDSW-24AT TaxID=2052957 RepID=UPI000C1DE638|nr:aldo/keto reductase [Pseudorhodobacter sp. MZDSW-24AT]PJF08500.1 aldo/keto reductase [Pseudorhodobacter sp. MZDSW-24AT]
MQTPPSTPLGQSVKIRRMITGLWQMADQERDGRALDLDAAAESLARYARAGFDTFDMADHYGSAECVAGMVHKAMRDAGETPPTILTKWCPPPGPMDAGTVRAGVERALDRLGLDCIDVMQFHWWRYEDQSYIDALTHLADLRAEGLIREIGLTNFDAAHLRMLVTHGVPIASNQVCFSMLDRRARQEMAEVAQAHGVAILAFGSMAGGFLSARNLGAPEPTEISDWSRMKYKRFIDTAGGWERLQSLLTVLDGVARRHDVSLSNIVTAWTLAQPGVSACIIGTRLTERDHSADNLRALSVTLTTDDLAEIEQVLSTLTPIPGDCGDEYRKPPFLTASGDLSHHLDALPPPFPVVTRNGRAHADSGSIWEEKAGFSRAVRSGSRILVSGTTATAPDGSAICPGDAGGQATFAFDKVKAAILSLGGREEDVVRTRIYLRHAQDWEAVSAAHARAFGTARPANTLIGGVDLIGEYLLEVEAEAEIAPS